MAASLAELSGAIDDAATSSGFSGVAVVHRDGQRVLATAYGLADRAHNLPVTADTRFALASGGKGLTALAAMRLVERGVLAIDAPVRQRLGADLPQLHADITLEHLLTHTSGISDYIDEDGDITDYALSVPSATLDSTPAYLPLLAACEQVAEPGRAFAYCNAGYVIAALVCERAAGVPFTELVGREVCAPAGLRRTEYLRIDELPGDVARGYLWRDWLRGNELHLPVVGSGDGGVYSSADDLALLWDAVLGGRVVSAKSLAAMVRPRVTVADEGKRYGMGFWLALEGPGVILEGYDAGVSMRSIALPRGKAGSDTELGTCIGTAASARGAALVASVLSNWSDGAWEVAEVVQRWVVGQGLEQGPEQGPEEGVEEKHAVNQR